MQHHKVWIMTIVMLEWFVVSPVHSMATKNLTNKTLSTNQNITTANLTISLEHNTTLSERNHAKKKTTIYKNSFVIITESTPSTPPPPPCCRHGIEAGSRGYICVAYPNFVEIRYHLPHPLKMKFDQRTRKFVQLTLARNIERCAKQKMRKRIYEGCCDRAQRRMFTEQARKKKLVEDCYAKGGRNCYQFYG